jgi:putative membrane protein
MMTRVALPLGLLAIGLAWFGPLPALAARSFAAHMALHMTVVAIAAPLLAIGLAGTRIDPVRHAPALFAAIPASLAELAVVWAWHAPALHHGARHHAGLFVVEQASFLAAGLFLWLSTHGGGVRLRSERAGSGIVALLLTFAHMTLLGALLALTPRPLYHAGGASALTAIADQQLGGSIMLVVGAIVYISGGLWLSHGLLRIRTPRAPGSLPREGGRRALPREGGRRALPREGGRRALPRRSRRRRRVRS